MKKFIAIVAWLAYLIIAIAICCVSLYVGSSCANIVCDATGVSGSWGAFFIGIPVLFMTSLATTGFFLGGLMKFKNV